MDPGRSGPPAHDLRGWPGVHHPPARVATARAEVDEPVRGQGHGRVVLDDHHRAARVDQVLQQPEQPFDVGRVQAGGRLVQQVERVPASRERCSSVASLIRCASPPDSSVAGWPSRR